MFKNLSITTKFLFWGIIIFVSLAFFFALFASNTIERLMIGQTKDSIIDFTRLHAGNNLKPENFSLGAVGNEDIFTNFFKQINTKNVLRIKVWDKEANIVFSDDKSIVGKNFSGDEELNEAMEGNVEAEIQEPVKPENIAEKGYGQLLEIYVPVFFSGDSRPAGIIEIYYKLDEVNKLIKEARLKILTSAVLSVFIFTFFIWIFLRRIIKDPILKLEKTADKIAKGDLDKRVLIKSQDELGSLADSFNKMVSELKKSHDSLEKSNIDLERRVKEKLSPYDMKIKNLESEVSDLKKTKDNLEEKLKRYM